MSQWRCVSRLRPDIRRVVQHTSYTQNGSAMRWTQHASDGGHSCLEQWLPITGHLGLMEQWHFVSLSAGTCTVWLCDSLAQLCRDRHRPLERSCVRCSVAACSTSVYSMAVTRQLATCRNWTVWSCAKWRDHAGTVNVPLREVLCVDQ